MKKDRDSFFGQYGSYGYNNTPYMYPNMNQNNTNNYDNINERISRLEREITNINNRISKLEASGVTTNNTDFNFANSMYMV